MLPRKTQAFIGILKFTPSDLLKVSKIQPITVVGRLPWGLARIKPAGTVNANTAMFLPEWNSPDAVRRFHDTLEKSAFSLSALLLLLGTLKRFAKRRKKLFAEMGLAVSAIAVLAQIFVSWYGRRNDELSANAVIVAQKEIAKLNVRAAEAEKDVQGLRREIAKADVIVADANKASSEANARATDANRKAEEERLERVNLEQRFVDRTLTDLQLAAITQTARAFPGQEYRIAPYGDISEQIALGRRISLALTCAGWKDMDPTPNGILLGSFEGVRVFVHPLAAKRTKEAADALIAVLLGQGIVTHLAYTNPQDPPLDRIFIDVGLKPNQPAAM